MPRSIETIHVRRAAQLKALAQVRNTLPAPDRAMVIEYYDRGAATLKVLPSDTGRIRVQHTLPPESYR